MKHIHYRDEEPVEVSEGGAEGVKIRSVIDDKDGAPNFCMRIVTFDPGGQSPNHSHPWEHEQYIIRGKGTMEVDGKSLDIKEGDVIYVPPNADHCFRATDPLEMV